MKKLPIYKLFSGYGEISIPDEIREITPEGIALSISEITEASILFITEKVDGSNTYCELDTLSVKPLAVVVSSYYSVSSQDIPLIRAENVRAALAYALSNSYGIDYQRMKLIGVTGTNGKTTTATIISSILKASGYKVGFIGTGKIISDNTTLTDLTYSMTTPDPTVLYPALAKMSADGCEYVVMEVSSHSIALGKIAPIRFEYSIFTNLDNDHLDFHKSKDEYFKTKLKLFDSSKRGLFNLDDEYSRRAYELARCEKSSFGILRQGDAYATEITLGVACSTFFFREKNLICKVSSRLIGAFNVNNSIAALKCAIDMGIAPCIAKRALEGLEKIDGRMDFIYDDITVIIDYAHTPSAFYNALKTIKQGITFGQNITAVFGCGGNRDAAKRPIFGKYAELLADKIIITEDNSRNESLDKIISDITAEISIDSCKIIKDREEAIRYAIRSSAPGDVVVILGKGHEKYKITPSGYLPFDEKAIVQSELEGLHKRHEN